MRFWMWAARAACTVIATTSMTIPQIAAAHLRVAEIARSPMIAETFSNNASPQAQWYHLLAERPEAETRFVMTVPPWTDRREPTINPWIYLDDAVTDFAGPCGRPSWERSDAAGARTVTVAATAPKPSDDDLTAAVEAVAEWGYLTAYVRLLASASLMPPEIAAPRTMVTARASVVGKEPLAVAPVAEAGVDLNAADRVPGDWNTTCVEQCFDAFFAGVQAVSDGGSCFTDKSSGASYPSPVVTDTVWTWEMPSFEAIDRERLRVAVISNLYAEATFGRHERDDDALLAELDRLPTATSDSVQRLAASAPKVERVRVNIDPEAVAPAPGLFGESTPQAVAVVTTPTPSVNVCTPVKATTPADTDYAHFLTGCDLGVTASSEDALAAADFNAWADAMSCDGSAEIVASVTVWDFDRLVAEAVAVRTAAVEYFSVHDPAMTDCAPAHVARTSGRPAWDDAVAFSRDEVLAKSDYRFAWDEYKYSYGFTDIDLLDQMTGPTVAQAIREDVGPSAPVIAKSSGRPEMEVGVRMIAQTFAHDATLPRALDDLGHVTAEERYFGTDAWCLLGASATENSPEIVPTLAATAEVSVKRQAPAQESVRAELAYLSLTLDELAARRALDLKPRRSIGDAAREAVAEAVRRVLVGPQAALIGHTAEEAWTVLATKDRATRSIARNLLFGSDSIARGHGRTLTR